MVIDIHAAKLKQLRERVADLEARLESARGLVDLLRKERNFFKQRAHMGEKVLYACQDYIFMYNRCGLCVYVSPGAAEALGIEDDEMIGKTWRELGFPSSVTELFQDSLEKVFLTGQEIRGEATPFAQRGQRYYEYILAPVRRKNGVVEYVVATLREITGIKRMQMELDEQYSTLDAIFENTLFPLAVLDRNFNFIRVNEAYARADDKEPAQFVGQNHFDLYPSDAREIFERVVETKEPCQVIARPFVYENNPERGVFYWDWTLMPVLDNSGEVDKLIYFLLDVTRTVRGEIALRNTLLEARKRNEEISALLKSSRAVMEYKNFKDAARAIYESCRDLLGATSGYICMKGRDGRNEVIYLETGAFPCRVDPSLPMPINGMREVVYREGKVLCENDFAKTQWKDLLPEGHLPLENVLCAPLVIEGKTWGLLAFGNKPGGFTENDVKMASALSRDVSIALYNSRLMDSLRHSEEHFRSVVQSASDAIITTDCRGNIVFWNETATSMFGYSQHEAVGRPLTIIMPERFHDQYKELNEREKEALLSDLTGRTIEKVGLRKDGQEIPVEFSVSSWTTGGEVYYTGIVRDLTRRRQDEEEVLRLASIVESTDDSVIGITLEGIILIWNRGAEKLYGYQAGEVRGRPVSFLLSQGSREEITGILNKIKNGARVDHYETVHLRKDGQNLHVSVSISPLKNYQGKTTGISIIARDISERIKMQQELQKSHERLGNILESMSEAFMSFDHQWRFRYVNREAEKICQRPRESLIGRNLWEELPEWVETMLYVQYHRAMNEGTAVDFELAGVHGDKVYEVFACPSPDGLSVFFRDITERKKLEKEMARLDRLNLVGQMAAGIGHEIRNPMTSIRGFLQILSGKSECDHYREYFDLMIEELDRANAIVTEFLSMARNKTAEMHLCNINLIVEAISPLLTADAFNSKTDMVFELGEVPEIPLDEKEIRQLIMNLARNGMEAMTRGGRLTIKTFREGDEVVLAVQDQGAGIDNEVMESIGVPFFTTKENGTGLGLATCYGIAARHNANIQLETGPSGTIFSVRFSI